MLLCLASYTMDRNYAHACYSFSSGKMRNPEDMLVPRKRGMGECLCFLLHGGLNGLGPGMALVEGVALLEWVLLCWRKCVTVGMFFKTLPSCLEVSLLLFAFGMRCRTLNFS